MKPRLVHRHRLGSFECWTVAALFCVIDKHIFQPFWWTPCRLYRVSWLHSSPMSGRLLSFSAGAARFLEHDLDIRGRREMLLDYPIPLQWPIIKINGAPFWIMTTAVIAIVTAFECNRVCSRKHIAIHNCIMWITAANVITDAIMNAIAIRSCAQL